MPGLEKQFSRYPQFYSRVGFVHQYKTLGTDELQFVLERHWRKLGKTLDANDFTDAQAIAAIVRITRGNFGGNVEAARRAGIKVNRIYMSALMLGTLFAALGGLLASARLTSASLSSGGGDTNLVAVIGGTSLFGERGKAHSALLGILVIQSISNGLTLLNLDSSIRYMITGAVLLLAVIIDSLSRRSRASHGQA